VVDGGQADDKIVAVVGEDPVYGDALESDEVPDTLVGRKPSVGPILAEIAGVGAWRPHLRCPNVYRSPRGQFSGWQSAERTRSLE
jgi:hypothetical protein